ncbi:MAG: glycoside hydrolase family 27 protein, partial [Bacteroidota bacterium]
VDYVKYDWCSYGEIARKIFGEKYAALLPSDAVQIRALTDEKVQLDSNHKRTDEQAGRLKQVNTELDAIIRKIKPEDKKRIELEIFQEPYKIFRASLDKVKRDIVFSFCQYGMGNVWEWGQQLGGNCWRTTGDIEDTWESLSAIGFSQGKCSPWSAPGRWNDPDMLVVGWVGWGPALHYTRLTTNEQYTHISLWSLLAAPLLIGCDLNQLDAFTLNLLTNDEVLAVNQDPLGKQAIQVKKTAEYEIWARDLDDGSKAVGLFNKTEKPLNIPVDMKELNVNGKPVLRDLWTQADLGKVCGHFEMKAQPHGVRLVKLTK